MTTALAPVEKSVWVPLTPDRAFDLYTRQLDTWWPVATHSLSASRMSSIPKSVTVEPRAGGRIMEHCADDTHAPWATITDWVPGARLGLSWYVGRPASEATQVLVTFTDDNCGTRVDVVHDGFDALGDAAHQIRDGYVTGWDLVLIDSYGKAAGAWSSPARPRSRTDHPQ